MSDPRPTPPLEAAALRVLHYWDMNSLDTPHWDASDVWEAFEALRAALGAPKVP